MLSNLKFKSFAPLLLCAFALNSFAQTGTPKYFSTGPSVQGTASSVWFFPAIEGLTPRIVYMSADSDKAASNFSLKKGVGAYAVGTNVAAGTLINLTTTNGLAPSDTVVIQTASGNITNFTISSFAAGFNVTLSGTPAWGYTNGDQLYKMSTATTLPCGAQSNKVYTGEAVYVGNQSRPIMVTIDGTSWSIFNLGNYRQE